MTAFVRPPLFATLSALAALLAQAPALAADQPSPEDVASAWSQLGQARAPMDAQLRLQGSMEVAAARIGAQVAGSMLDVVAGARSGKYSSSGAQHGAMAGSLIDRFNSFKLTDHGIQIGSIDREGGNLMHRGFEIKNAEGRIIGSTKRENLWDLTLFHRITDVYDGEGRLIAKVRQRLLTSVLTLGLYSKYDILDASGRVIAVSKKPLHLLDTTFNIVSADDKRVLVSLKRPILQISDPWEIEIKDGSVVDPRVIMSIIAEKSTSDHE